MSEKVKKGRNKNSRVESTCRELNPYNPLHQGIFAAIHVPHSKLDEESMSSNLVTNPLSRSCFRPNEDMWPKCQCHSSQVVLGVVTGYAESVRMGSVFST